MCFPVLLVEYYTGKCLERAGNKIGCTIKVDITTLLASHGKFAGVCIEINLTRPLKAGYKLKRELHEIQYEGLHELCFHFDRYGHRLIAYLATSKMQSPNKGERITREPTGTASGGRLAGPTKASNDQRESVYGAWMIVTKPRRRATKQTKSLDSEMVAPSLSQTAPQSTVVATKNKDKITTNLGSQFSILTDQVEDLNEEPK